MNRFYSLLFAFFIAVGACAETREVSQNPLAETPAVRNIIFMIGDGMGLAQVYAGTTANQTPLAFEQFPYTGLSKTYSADNYITDSAAGGTALACGEKTNNGMVGMRPDKTPLYSTLYLMAQQGWATGVVVTSSITDATPAAFVAHQSKRSMHKEIAADFMQNTPDVFIGGGRQYFDQQQLDELKKRGYDVANNLDELQTSTASKLTALLADDGVPSMLAGRGEMLPIATEKTINILKNSPKGFFLMVEGSQIDWQAHANKTEGVVAEVVDFSNAIQKALDFARKDGHTLVVVTADHETGGMAITGGNIAQHEVSADFSSTGHSALPVIVYAYGPGAEQFSGFMENTALKGKMLRLLNLEAY